VDELGKAISLLRQKIEGFAVNPAKGLPEELFLLVSELVPLVNVDLMVIDKQKGVLLSWRDDPFSGTGWHIPGGCVRLREALEQRIQRTAITELGYEVIFEPKPIAVEELIASQHRENIVNQNTRAHNIALLYECRFSDGVTISNEGRDSTTPGYLQWYKTVPTDLLPLQKCYQPIINTYLERRSYV